MSRDSGFNDSKGGNRHGNIHNSNYTNSRGPRGGGDRYNDDYNSSFLESSRRNLTWTSGLPSFSGYDNNINQNYEPYWSPQGYSSYESRYCNSGKSNNN